MADTTREYNPNGICADCGGKGTDFRHWGDLIPSGEVLDLCAGCMEERSRYFGEHQTPKPVGKAV